MTSTLLYEISLLNQIKNFSPIDLNLNQYEIGFVEKYCKCMISKFCRKLQSWNFPQNKTIHFNFSFLAFVCPTHDIVYLIKSKKEKSLFFALLKSCQLSLIFCVSARVKFDLGLDPPLQDSSTTKFNHVFGRPTSNELWA